MIIGQSCCENWNWYRELQRREYFECLERVVILMLVYLFYSVEGFFKN